MNHPYISSLSIHYANLDPIACTELSPHVNVIYGHNEAGKSRIRDFLEWIMFASSEEVDALKNAATKKAFAHLDPSLSGSASIMINGELVTISQQLTEGITQVHSNSSTILPRDLSRALTDGLSRAHYNNVFSLSLDALSQEESNRFISEDDLMNLFFGASMTGSGVSPTALVAELARLKDEMFSEKKQTKNKSINRVLKELSEWSTQIKQLRLEEKGMDAIDAEIVQHQQRLIDTEQALEAIRTGITEKNKVVSNADDFTTYERLSNTIDPEINTELVSHIVEISMLINSCKEHIEQNDESERDRLRSSITSLDAEHQRQYEELNTTISPDGLDISVRTPQFISIVQEEERARVAYSADVKTINDNVVRYSADLALVSSEADQCVKDIELIEAETAREKQSSDNNHSGHKTTSSRSRMGIAGIAIGLIAGTLGLIFGQSLAVLFGFTFVCAVVGYFFVYPQFARQPSPSTVQEAGNQQELLLSQARRDLSTHLNKQKDYQQRIEKLLDDQQKLSTERNTQSRSYTSALSAAGFPTDTSPHLISLYLDGYKTYTDRAQRLADLTAALSAIEMRLETLFARADNLRNIAQGTACATTGSFRSSHSLGDIYSWASALHDIAQEHKTREETVLQADAQRRELEKQLTMQFSSIENARAIYSSISLEDIGFQLTQLLEQKNMKEAERQEIDRAIGGFAKERERLSRSTSLSDATLQIQLLTEELKALHEQYRGLHVSHLVVTRALEVFRRNNQPELLRVASTMLRGITGGNWENITVEQSDSARSSEPIIRVTGDRAPHGLSITQLSRGTREQLYLSLRLALMQTSQRGKGIPVLFDDIAVNADQERFACLAPIIDEIAQSRQVFYFTCHEWVRDELVRNARANVVHL